MRAYVTLAKAVARSTTTYRLNFVLSMFGIAFQLFALLAVWRVLLAPHPLGGFSWPDMKAYLLIAFGSGALVSLYADFRMAGRIQDGTVALDLTKPIDYQTARFAETVGGVGVELVVVALVTAGVLAVSGPVPVPPPARLALFAVSALAVIPLKFLVVYLTSLACFWTQNYLGLNWARLAVVNLLSGALVPLSFFPGWAATLVRALPFAGITSTPALVYVGQVSGVAAVRLVALQLGWIVVLWFGARLGLRRALRQLTVHGG